MELYKYTGSVAAMTVRFGKAETITLYDSYDDSVAPVRLDVRGALAEYIKEIESTDSEERYMNLDWYYDFNMLLRRIEVPGVPSEKFQMAGVPAKVLTQTRSNPDELDSFVELVKLPEKLSPLSKESVLEWFYMHRAYRDDRYDGMGCSGQFFTTRVRLFRRRGCWYAYHFVSVDM